MASTELLLSISCAEPYMCTVNVQYTIYYPGQMCNENNVIPIVYFVVQLWTVVYF